MVSLYLLFASCGESVKHSRQSIWTHCGRYHCSPAAPHSHPCFQMKTLRLKEVRCVFFCLAKKRFKQKPKAEVRCVNRIQWAKPDQRSAAHHYIGQTYIFVCFCVVAVISQFIWWTCPQNRWINKYIGLKNTLDRKLPREMGPLPSNITLILLILKEYPYFATNTHPFKNRNVSSTNKTILGSLCSLCQPFLV